MVHALQVWWVFTKLFLPHNPAVALGIYPEELNIYVHTKLAHWFQADLFLIAKT